jgi:nitrite reductase/ring-hydroxylating ferredoxin subunit
MAAAERCPVLCALADLADPGTRSFQVGSGDWALAGFIVRQGDRLHAYLNRCPHAGHSLNLLPHRFLNADATLLLCTSHGALFAPESGECVAGPCLGSRLTPLSIRLDGDLVRYTGVLPDTRAPDR